MATKQAEGKSSAEATVTQPARVGSGKVKTEGQREAHQTTTETPETPKDAKAQADLASNAGDGGVPKVVPQRGAADDSVAVSETQESRTVPVTQGGEATPRTEVEQRKRAEEAGSEPRLGASFDQLAEATIYTDIVELANTLNSAVVTFETRLAPTPGFEPLQPPRGTKKIIEQLHDLVEDVRDLVDSPEKQHKNQKKDRIERDIVE